MKKYKEVVINICYGGFGLSSEAVLELFKMECKHIKVLTEDKYFGKPKDYHSKIFGSEEKYRENHIKNCGLAKHSGMILLDEHRDGDRDCPILVRVIRKLKGKADGCFAKLAIVKIPANVKFTIEGYDGKEHVEEQHKSWG